MLCLTETMMIAIAEIEIIMSVIMIDIMMADHGHGKSEYVREEASIKLLPLHIN